MSFIIDRRMIQRLIQLLGVIPKSKNPEYMIHNFFDSLPFNDLSLSYIFLECMIDYFNDLENHKDDDTTRFISLCILLYAKKIAGCTKPYIFLQILAGAIFL